MRASTERLAGLAALMLAAVPALAAEPPEPLLGARLEAQAGLGAPLGTISGALVFQPTPAIAFGLGAGLATGQPRGPYPQFGGFLRANVWRREGLTLGPVVTLSGGNHARDVTYQRPQYESTDAFRYDWKPGFRLDAGVGAELALDRLSLRLEAGLGVYLNDPTCWYTSQMTSFVGACDAPEIPAPYHFTFEPGRLAPYVSLAVGYNAGRPHAEPAATESTAAPPSRADSAWLAPTALTVPAGSITVALYEAVLARVTVGLTDRLQIWAGTSWTDLIGSPIWEAGAKLGLVSVGRFHLALVAEHIGIRTSAWTGLVLTGGGAVASVCLDAACASVVSVLAAGGWLYQDNDDSPSETKTAALVSPSAVIVVARFLKLVVESHVPSTTPRDGLWAALLRVPLGGLTLDLGILGTYSELGEIAPAGTIAYRW